MLGAIIGDIIGSVYRWNNIKTEGLSFISEGLLLQMTRL